MSNDYTYNANTLDIFSTESTNNASQMTSTIDINAFSGIVAGLITLVLFTMLLWWLFQLNVKVRALNRVVKTSEGRRVAFIVMVWMGFIAFVGLFMMIF